MRIFVEATGSLVSHGLIAPIQESGNTCIASDASQDSVGRFLADEFYQVPLASDTNYTEKIIEILITQNVQMVIPTLDDAILKWDLIRDKLASYGITLALSEQKSLEICQDKWNTYQFFLQNNIPTPKTSLSQDYELIKPRNGRGGAGIFIASDVVDMTGQISQEILRGTEYTIDVFCNLHHTPIYIIPRKRIGVKEGKSTAGIVVKRFDIEDIVKRICQVLPFTGAINIQCFDTKDGLMFTEINPRFGGGTILSMKATENWISLTVKTFCEGLCVEATHSVDYGLKMRRYYAEVFYRET